MFINVNLINTVNIQQNIKQKLKLDKFSKIIWLLFPVFWITTRWSSRSVIMGGSGPWRAPVPMGFKWVSITFWLGMTLGWRRSFRVTCSRLVTCVAQILGVFEIWFRTLRPAPITTGLILTIPTKKFRNIIIIPLIKIYVSPPGGRSLKGGGGCTIPISIASWCCLLQIPVEQILGIAE